MDGHKFRSGLTEVTGDGTYKCITMSKISLQPLTSVRPSRAAPSQLKSKWRSLNHHMFTRHRSSTIKIMHLLTFYSVLHQIHQYPWSDSETDVRLGYFLFSSVPTYFEETHAALYTNNMIYHYHGQWIITKQSSSQCSVLCLVWAEVIGHHYFTDSVAA